MPLPCEAIIFDLDGVLVDSADAIEQYWRRWAEDRGIPFDEVKAVYHGRPTVEVIQEVAPHLDAEAETERVGAEFTADTDNVTAYEGAEALLETVPDDRWTIATSGRRRTATTRLRAVGFPVPDTLVTADDINSGKPAPDPYLLAAERLGVTPDQCVVFEDAPAGVTAARKAGTQVVGVATMSSREALAAADVVVPQLNDVEIRFAETNELCVEWEDGRQNGSAH